MVMSLTQRRMLEAMSKHWNLASSEVTFLVDSDW